MIKILSVLPVLGQPRDSKRIGMLKKLGFEVRVLAFERKYHKGRLPDCEIKSLGKIAHGKYLARILRIIRAIPVLRKSIKACDVVYASGPDMAYMSLFAGLFLKKTLILEVGDIRKIQVNSNMIGIIVRAIDRYFVKKCDLLIVTSPDFYEEYYSKWLKVTIPVVILENKVDDFTCSLSPIINRSIVSSKIKIGYFGLLRCEWTWNVLKRLSENDKFQIFIAGYPMISVDFSEEANNNSNIEYFGEYKSPDDLAELYGSVDIVWASYPLQKKHDWNMKWARTNRFYESCFYKKPVICLKNTSDSKRVKHLNIGLVLQSSEVEYIVNKIGEVTEQMLDTWNTNIRSLDESIYIYSEKEMSELKSKIVDLSK